MEDEEVKADLDLSDSCRVVLTSHRVLIWETEDDVEHFTPISLDDVSGVELKEEGYRLRFLVLAIVLSLAGAALLPRLIEAFSGAPLGQQLPDLGLGVLGLGLLVAGFLLLGVFLNRVIFPVVELTFYGTPEVTVRISPRARRRARELIRYIGNLKLDRR